MPAPSVLLPWQVWLLSSVAAIALMSCGSGSPRGAGAPAPGTPAGSAELRPAVDPLPFLREQPPTSRRSWVVPRSAWLDVGETSTASEGEDREPVEVLLVEGGATLVRIAFRSPQLRFVAWVPRHDLLGVLARSVELRAAFADPTRELGARLHPGARVERLERKEQRVKIRYSGVLEVETWVDADALADEGEPTEDDGPGVRGHGVLQALPGLAIRSEPRWGSELLAVLARGYFVEDVRAVDATWNEVSYADHAVEVHGFASRQQPPMRVHATVAPEALPVLASNDTLTAGTCLYASPTGEVVGVAGPVPALTAAEERDGWWSVTLDTPWGALRFAARRERGGWAPCE